MSEQDKDNMLAQIAGGLISHYAAQHLDEILLSDKLDFDPRIIYCVKTGRPIGNRFPSEIAALIELHGRDKAVDILRRANRTGVSLSWIETSGKSLDVLYKEQPETYLAFAFSKLIRLAFPAHYDKRDVDQWQTDLVELHKITAAMPIAIVRDVAHDLVAVLSLNIKRLEIRKHWQSLRDIINDETLPTGEITAKLRHIVTKEYLRLEQWAEAVSIQEYVSKNSKGSGSMFRHQSPNNRETNVENILREMRISGFEMVGGAETIIASRYTENLKKPKFGQKAFTFADRPATIPTVSPTVDTSATTADIQPVGKMSFAAMMAAAQAKKGGK